MNEENVQSEQTSTEETTSQETKTEEQVKEQPFSEDQEARIQQMVAQASTEATKTAIEAGRRQLQGEQDRNKNAEGRARLAESRVNAYETSFKGLDEDTQKDVELARYREENKIYQSTAQEEAREKTQKQQEEVYFQQMNSSLVDEVRSWGVDPDDKRLDFASDASDYFTGRKRFTDSLQKIVKENEKVAEKKQGEKFSEMEAKLRKDLGLDSVDTTAGSGGGSDSDAEFTGAYNDGSRDSPADHKRAAGILKNL